MKNMECGLDMRKINDNQLDFDRIKHLLNPEELRDVVVTIIGLGSGGSPLCRHLVMNGVRNLILFDFDVYEAVNLVKSPGKREDITGVKADRA